jgi:hypothetical protein
MMRRRHGFALAMVLWTLAVVIVAAVMAVAALVSLDAANQRCFFDYPASPCPGQDDPALVWIWIAFFGMPAVWVVGVIVAFAAKIRRAGQTPPS